MTSKSAAPNRRFGLVVQGLESSDPFQRAARSDDVCVNREEAMSSHVLDLHCIRFEVPTRPKRAGRTEMWAKAL